MDENEILATAIRETRLAAGVGSDIARSRRENPEGVPLDQVRQALTYWKVHLNEALNAVQQLEQKADQNRLAPGPL